MTRLLQNVLKMKTSTMEKQIKKCAHMQRKYWFIYLKVMEMLIQKRWRERERVEEERGTPLLSALFTYPKINDISFILI